MFAKWSVMATYVAEWSMHFLLGAGWRWRHLLATGMATGLCFGGLGVFPGSIFFVDHNL